MLHIKTLGLALASTLISAVPAAGAPAAWAQGSSITQAPVTPPFQDVPLACSSADLGGPRAAPTTWPNGVVYFEFDANVTSQQKVQAYAAMDELMRIGAAVSFVLRTPGVNDSFYIHILDTSTFSCPPNGPQDPICPQNSATVGMSWAGQTFRMFNWSHRFIIVHELLHTLGFWHEHTRWDRDAFVTINTANIVSDQEHNFTIRLQGDWIASATPYDFDSVMHYDACAFNNCSPPPQNLPCCPTITVHPPSQASIGQYTFLSALDQQDVLDAYGAGPRARYLRPVTVGSAQGTLTNPFSSIQMMNFNARSGATVNVQGHTYDDGATITMITEHMTIQPYGGVVTIR